MKEIYEIHGDTYDHSKIQYVNSKTKIIVICREHGEFLCIPTDYLKGTGCRKCKGLAKLTTEEFIGRAKKIHGDLYDYSKANYINNSTKVTIICRKHGEFNQVASSHHLANRGCQQCAGNLKLTTQKFVEKAVKVHGDRYDYTKVDYKNIDTHVVIICKIHNEFKVTPYHHLVGRNCRKCAGNHHKTNEEFIEKSIQIHGEGKYSYENLEYGNKYGHVNITCSKHGPFSQKAESHLLGRTGCIKCRSCPLCELWVTNGKICCYCKPQDENKKYQKTKEYKVVNYLKSCLPDEEFIHNKSVGKACTGKNIFPDVLFERSGYNLIVEIDEFKHRGSSYECDKQRMYDIIANLGLPCLFIRYNPDHKNSSQKVLLATILENLNNENIVWDDYGFKAIYLFYGKNEL